MRRLKWSSMLISVALATALGLAIGCQAAPAATPTAKPNLAPTPAQVSTTAASTNTGSTVAPVAASPTAAAAAKLDYPTRPIEMVVPFGAGGAADVAARKLSALVEKDLGQSINIVNVTGAGGALAYTQVKTSRPDGYKLLWSSAAMATLPAQGNIDFDYTALDHVALVSTETVSLTVATESPWKTLKEFLDEAKKQGATKPLTVGNSGIGSFTHLAAVAIGEKAGVPLTHVAFGTGLAVTNLIGGHINASSQHPAEILPALKSGQVRMLAVSSDKRIDAFKDVPTLKEQGIDLVLEQFRGISVAKGTPKPIVERLEAAFIKAANSQEWNDYNSSVGAAAKVLNSADYTKFVADQHVQIAELSKKVQESAKK